MTFAEAACSAEPPQPKACVSNSRANARRKDNIPEIPDAYWRYSGRVKEVHADDDSAAAVFEELFGRKRFLSCFPDAGDLPMPIGVDLEWKPDKFQKPKHPIALIQIACWDVVLLIRTVGCKKLPLWLAGCLEDPTRIKITASFDLSDQEKLFTSFGWKFSDKVSEASSFVDVAELAKERHLPFGLKKMASEFELPMLKLKEIGCSDWSKTLSDAQRQYAAEDAFFTLYLFGCLLERAPLSHGGLAAGAFAAWKLSEGHMRSLLERVENIQYKKSFFELREVVRDAISSLCTALGSGGATTINNILKVKGVESALKNARRTTTISLDSNFLKTNRDLFVMYWDHKESTLKVRLRHNEDEDDDYDEEGEDEHQFVSRILEMLASYEPPAEKRQSVLHRSAPQPLWVPAKALVGKNEQERLQNCANRHRDSFECASTDDDGLILRLLRHPRALDSEAQLRLCCSKLQEALGPDVPKDEAERRLRADEKFVLFYMQLPLIERGSPEEAAASRSLKARAHILSDAHIVGARVKTSWEVARDALEKVKWYRQALGARLAAEAGDGGSDGEQEMKVCLDAIVEAWPDLENIVCPKRGKKRGADHVDSQDSRAKGRGKGRKQRR